MSERLHRTIGIDLGTTYSAVAAYNKDQDRAEIILNHAEGNAKTIPSVVSFSPHTRRVFVGESAKRNMPFDSANTVAEIKREMGEMFTDDTLSKFGAVGTFTLEDPARVRMGDEWFKPQEISALILMKMKEIAKAGGEGAILDAVVTVPAYFTERQRNATKEAALLAGLYPRELISEPTAAAICYGVDRWNAQSRVYLVYDLGGGTFDVSIIRVRKQNIDVLATSGDSRLGGVDFDNAIVEWCNDRLSAEYNINLKTDPVAQAKLKILAEAAKITLSAAEAATIPLADVLPPGPGRPPSLTLTRGSFEQMIDDPFLDNSIQCVEKALKFASENKDVARHEIDAILLVGGSTRIPRVAERLLTYFDKDRDFIRDDADPDTVVARGAATVALRYPPSAPPFNIERQMEAEGLALTNELSVSRIAEHSLGVEVQGGGFVVVIPAGTGIPVSKTQSGFTNAGETNRIVVSVYQGMAPVCKDNTKIGEIEIPDLEPRPQGSYDFEVTFSLSASGLLSVTIYNKNENRKYPGSFGSVGGSGGPKALKAMQGKLLSLYEGAAQTTPGGAVPSARPPAGGAPDLVPPPPPPPQREAVEIHNAGQGTSPPPGESAERVSVEAGPPGGIGVAAEADTSADSEVEVPAQYSPVADIVRERLARSPNPGLRMAYDNFLAGITSGVSDEDLEKLANALKQALINA